MMLPSLWLREEVFEVWCRGFGGLQRTSWTRTFSRSVSEATAAAKGHDPCALPPVFKYGLHKEVTTDWWM